ncbi:mucin-5AC [Manduca sexta]|uniref:Uncharacterized protein n=1 Tax=Manduca sexta TaxID=7130 RepID=A0A922CG25_MANSE|nr:mucin-5AC [Manduca sexta]KAG6445565.1 hypothetical protein O3G_MSEX004003 [Manduca sexta]
MSESQENKDCKGGNTTRAASVIKRSAAGNVCPIEDLDRACDITQDSANTNAPTSGPTTGASNEVVESAVVIPSPASDFQQPARIMTRSRRPLENAATAGQQSLNEMRPPRTPSRQGMTFVQDTHVNEAPRRGVRSLPTSPEPMDTDAVITVVPESDGDSKHESSANNKSSIRSNITTRSFSTIRRLGDTVANASGREERVGRDRRVMRIKQSLRNSSSSNNPIFVRRTHGRHSRTLRSNLRNIIDGSMGSLKPTPIPTIINTYRGKRDAQKADTSRDRKTKTRNIPIASGTSEPITSAATITSDHSTSSTAIAADPVIQQIDTSHSNPHPTTESFTAQMPTKSPSATSTLQTIAHNQDSATSVVVANASESGTTAMPRSTNDGTQVLSQEALKIVTLPADITSQEEIVDQATIEIRRDDQISISFSELHPDDSNVAENVTVSDNITCNEDSVPDITVSTNASDVIMISDNVDVRSLSPTVSLPSMPLLRTTPSPSVESDSATVQQLCSDDITSKYSSDNGEKEEKKD